MRKTVALEERHESAIYFSDELRPLKNHAGSKLNKRSSAPNFFIRIFCRKNAAGTDKNKPRPYCLKKMREKLVCQIIHWFAADAAPVKSVHFCLINGGMVAALRQVCQNKS